MAFLCPVRIKKHKRKGVPPRQLDAPLPGRITGSDSIDTLVRVGLEKERGPRARMVVVHDFVPCVDDELAVKRNQQVQVLYQENDWLYVITEDGKEGFIPYTYCLPVERSVDDFVLPKSKREYLTQSRLTGGHVKSEPQVTSNLVRTDSKSMPDITKVEQRQRRGQPVGEAHTPSQQDLNRNTLPQNEVKLNQISQDARASARGRDSKPTGHQASMRSNHHNQMSRSRDSSRTREAMDVNHSRAESREHLQGGRSRDPSRTRETSLVSREPSTDRTLNRSFSTSHHMSQGSSHPQQQQVNYKSAPTTPDWNRHRRSESQSPDYYNLLPLEVAVSSIEAKTKTAKNSVSGSLYDTQLYSHQHSWHSSGSQPNLNQSHQVKTNSSRSSQSSNSPRTNVHQRSLNTSSTQISQRPQEKYHASQERLSHNHRLEAKSAHNHKPQEAAHYNHQTYNHKPQEKPTYSHKPQEPASHNHQDKSAYNHRYQAQFTQNSPFYQPSHSSTLPRNFAAAPAKQNFQRTQSYHESHPSQPRPTNYQHQRQNSLPANYDHTKHNQQAQKAQKNHSQTLLNQSTGSQLSETSSLFEKRTYGQYIALFPYSPRQENDIGVERGEFVTLLNKDDEDWYWIRKENRHEGFVPKSFLCPAEGQEDSNSAKKAPSSQHTNTFPRHQSAPRPMSPVPQAPPPAFNLQRATKLVCRYDYRASAPDDLSVSRGQWVYADLEHQPDREWLWVYSPVSCNTGYIPRTYAKPPNFGSLSNLNEPTMP